MFAKAVCGTATMRTVQDIVSNALSLQLFRIEAELHVSSPSLSYLIK
jgi:hypothetical protein